MKRLTLILLIMGNSLIGISSLCQAQTQEEWLKQKKTQRKYLLEQIAALKMYLGYAQKGYTITQTGLKTIRNLKNGEWQLHQDFFNSLSQVNPTIRRYARVADILALQTKIFQIYQSTFAGVKKEDVFTLQERDYLYRVYAALLENGAAIIENLTSVISPAIWQLTDEERLNRIDALYLAMVDNYAFALRFGKEAQILALQRQKEKNEVVTSQALHNIQNE